MMSATMPISQYLVPAEGRMEPAWEKVTGLKFQLCEKSYLLANGVTKKQPFYQLTKTECLYIATKFNDEARAKLVLRWQELELEEGFATPHSALQRRRKMSEVRCLPEPKEILQLADHIMGEALSELNADAEDTLTATQVAKTFNMSVYDFNCVVRDMGIQYRRHGRWNISDDLVGRDLVRLRTHVSYSLKGEKKVRDHGV